jgi:hypothetical protein
MKDGVMSDQDRENWGQGAGERQEGGRSEGGRREGAGRRGGGGGDRETGGFRIRLSDNELRAARSIQEALQLRSTVAVLGFSLRTVAQLLEQGALDQIVAQQQQAGSRPERGERPERSDRGGERGERGERRVIGGAHQRSARPDPFARPSKPAVQEEVVEIAPELDAGADEVTASTEGANIEGASDEGASEAVTNGEPVEA